MCWSFSHCAKCIVSHVAYPSVKCKVLASHSKYNTTEIARLIIVTTTPLYYCSVSAHRRRKNVHIDEILSFPLSEPLSATDAEQRLFKGPFTALSQNRGIIKILVGHFKVLLMHQHRFPPLNQDHDLPIGT